MINFELIDISGLYGAIHGMRNAMNSWDKSDSEFGDDFRLGKNDLELCKRLAKAGESHRKFLRMIHVQFDLTAPFYFWKQFDTYKIGTTSNSCSTMHKIMSRKLNLMDFSTETLDIDDLDVLIIILDRINNHIELAKKENNSNEKKKHFESVVKLLPECFMQKRTIDLNYEVLIRIVNQRENHKLKEWNMFCDDIKKLPFVKDFLDIK